MRIGRVLVNLSQNTLRVRIIRQRCLNRPKTQQIGKQIGKHVRHTSIRDTAAGTQWQGAEGVERSSCVQLH